VADVRRLRRWRLLERLVGAGLFLMARLACREGDLHEANHLLAQLEAGDTTNCGPDCPLRCPTVRNYEGVRHGG
jgi:hypothetical protein